MVPIDLADSFACAKGDRIRALLVEQVKALLDFHGVDDLVKGSQGHTIKKPILFQLVRYDGAILS
jgi:hypothetical protein